MYLYLNGELIQSEEAKISIFDHGYLYGIGLFETFRTYAGHPFLLGNHLERLADSCQQIGLVWQKDERLLKEQIARLLAVNELSDGYFRYNLSAGPHPIGLRREKYQNLTEALFVKALPPPATQKRLYTVSIPRNTPEGVVRIKSHHYLNNLLAYREAPPDTEGVFLTKEGYVAEGVVSNLFFVKAGQVYTPSISMGILAGITRQWVLKAAQLAGLQVHEGAYSLSFAQEAEEVFMTNSIQEIVAVSEWDDHRYSLQEAKVSKQLKEIYDHHKFSLAHVDELRF